MSAKVVKNRAHSIRERLKRQASLAGADPQAVILRYGLERLVHRLSVSAWADRYALKGGLLASLYMGGDLPRPTADVDLNGFHEDESMQTLRDVVVALADADCDDGLVFDLRNLRILHERTLRYVPGGTIKFTALLGNDRLPMQIDVGFGNPITPDCALAELPTLLPDDVPRPVILTYPVETTFAEKFHAMVRYGAANSRFKDYYDIWKLSERVSFASGTLAEAIRRTLSKDNMDVPGPDAVEAMSMEFAGGGDAARGWSGFVAKHRLSAPDFPTVMERVASVIGPALRGAEGPRGAVWNPAHAGWDEAPEEAEDPSPTPRGP